MRAIRCSMEGSMCATGRMFDTPAQEQSLWWFRNSALSPYIHKEYDTFSIYPQRHMVLFPCIHTEIWHFLRVPKKKFTISGTHLWIWLLGAKEKLHDYLCCKTPRLRTRGPNKQTLMDSLIEVFPQPAWATYLLGVGDAALFSESSHKNPYTASMCRPSFTITRINILWKIRNVPSVVMDARAEKSITVNIGVVILDAGRN